MGTARAHPVPTAAGSAVHASIATLPGCSQEPGSYTTSAPTSTAAEAAATPQAVRRSVNAATE
ncbi:hypothetical protein [Streptomyces sp. LN325]|uniref:hypothetical protein n=1 Tax=Streptomyces sp. LN325 TaxID=3112976 RepID=UPI0037108841